jgi:hypothetical protein
MPQDTTRVSFARGQRLDLHITALRNEAEDAFGAAFNDAAALGRKLDDPNFTNDQFDAEVIGLICSVILRTRPLPRFLRKALGLLLQVTPEERADMMTVPVNGRKSSVQARTDRVTLDFLIDNLKKNLYPVHAFAGPFTDLGCGLDGLKLTWRRDILAEADESGIISTQGLRRIRSKLSAATIQNGQLVRPLLLDNNGKVTSGVDQSRERESERRLRLIEIVERAINIGSTVQCVPSRVREERISQAFERAIVSAERTA